MSSAVDKLLTTHLIIITCLLLLFGYILLRKGLFRWNLAGFWAWSAFTLYYVINPFYALIQGDTYRYRYYLYIVGGTNRGYWILFVAVIGIIFFFLSYLHTNSKKITWNLSRRELTLPMVVILVPFILYGVYSLLTYRASLVSTGDEIIITSSRYTGQVSGYDNNGYMFLFVPMLLLLLSNSPVMRFFGWIVTGSFFFLALPNSWSRYSLISILIAVSIADSLRRKSAFPRIWMVPIIFVITIALQQRGHEDWTLTTEGERLLNLASNSLHNAGEAVSSSDTSMLATWYLESYTKDTITGYDYGLPLLNYVLTGWIPNRMFAQKYFIIDSLRSRQPVIDATIYNLLYGSKSSLFGSFYNEGGIAGVIILASIMGFLSRKLDGMILVDSPLLVQTVGIAWMSVLWMLWGSHDTWGLMTLGTLLIPILPLWLIASKNQLPRNPVKPIKSIM